MKLESIINIKNILLVTLFIFILGGCMSIFTGNETAKNKRLKPELDFDGNRLEMAKAIHQNNKKKVEQLLKQGIDVNELSSNNDGMTYLLYSVMLDNRLDIAELLLQYKADPNKVSKVLYHKRHVYYLPLTSVSMNKSIEYMELLLKYGADPNQFAYDDTGGIALNAMPAINAAVRSAYILYEWSREDYMNDIKARIELLLKYGASIDSIGAMNQSVVESAASEPEIVLYLMDKRADHRIYGKKLLKWMKNSLEASPNDKDVQEIIRRLNELGYQ